MNAFSTTDRTAHLVSVPSTQALVDCLPQQAPNAPEHIDSTFSESMHDTLSKAFSSDLSLEHFTTKPLPEAPLNEGQSTTHAIDTTQYTPVEYIQAFYVFFDQNN